MVDPECERHNFFGRVEFARYKPRVTLRLKLACDDRTDLRMTIGIANDLDAKTPEHELEPETFNGWQIFGDVDAGHIPIGGSDVTDPIEVGIDLTTLLEAQGPDTSAPFRLSLKLSRADGSKTTGDLHEAAVRVYDRDGKFQRELPWKIADGHFGESTLEVQTDIRDLPSMK